VKFDIRRVGVRRDLLRMTFAQHEALQDAVEFFTLAAVVINSTFLVGVLRYLKRQREREDAAMPPPLEEWAKRVAPIPSWSKAGLGR
jgi:hypothetical protein